MLRVLTFLMALVVPMISGGHAESDDLSTYWPGDASHALWGRNVMNDTPTVLWFEWQDGYTFRQYNSDPEHLDARCNFDTLSWWDDGYLRYLGTTNVCAHTEVRYDPPIIIMPRLAPQTDWQLPQRADVTVLLDDEIRCRGTMYATASVSGMHVRSVQNTDWLWTKGTVATCPAGMTTHWQEDYTLGTLPLADGGQARGIIESAGGNQDFTVDRWDVRFEQRAALD